MQNNTKHANIVKYAKKCKKTKCKKNNNAKNV